ncbi:MAG: hypothetical protein IB617_02155 [Candidatus Nealsonbacteria bacterium]|nr:MAG: hypothetical protein IB617_02155 [Candidatus Nealsonbacteria bacterium]
MPFTKANLYKDAVALAKELFRNGEASKFGSLESIIKEIFETLKEINEEIE